ncbi:carboxylesterase/lipase family protein [Gluconobacter thailandicus]|uniref:Carboxylic ester hydrolase n=1 Tax=Gluconobacter thailandicus TaxID=257438 RepID=A0AAP9JIC3_GLUTH|nr:carboxylesterase family protein [Gluconobacter thailandicus]QEH96845.1 carboxylesterase family protein [Gluconobacter thailandicus]
MDCHFGRRRFLVAGSAALVGLGGGQIPVRKTTSGHVSGRSTIRPGVTAWLGIPYAAPPVGELRWKPPQPVQPWKGIREASQFGASPWAPSSKTGSMGGFMPSHMDEDCLTLNVWAPPSDGRLRPVMVWIYGGAFIMGTTEDPLYDGARLAAEDVVVVSINYRVGILGSFAHPDLARESPHGVSGNYGLMDQIAALRWVRDNIAEFGGDPDQVTIFGQSAGAFSVGYHLVMPQSRGLFGRAIAESGAPLGQPSSYILLGRTSEMEQLGSAFAQRLGATDIAALRQIPARKIVDAYGFSWQFYPAIDGWLVPDHPYTMMASGRCARVPVMAGHNHDEGMVFPPLGGGTQAGFVLAGKGFYGAQSLDVLRVLEQEGHSTPPDMGHEIFGDVVFNWNSIALSMIMARVAPSFAYRFDYRYARSPSGSDHAQAEKGDGLGAFHGAEIGFVFGTHRFVEAARRHEQEHLMRVMSGYWLNFARSGDPNGSGLPHWPQYRPGDRKLFRLDSDRQEVTGIENYDRLVLLGRAMNNRLLEQG